MCLHSANHPRFTILQLANSCCTTDHADMVELVPGTHAVDVGENPNNPFLAENWDGTCASHLNLIDSRINLVADSDLRLFHRHEEKVVHHGVWRWKPAGEAIAKNRAYTSQQDKLGKPSGNLILSFPCAGSQHLWRQFSGHSRHRGRHRQPNSKKR